MINNSFFIETKANCISFQKKFCFFDRFKETNFKKNRNAYTKIFTPINFDLALEQSPYIFLILISFLNKTYNDYYLNKEGKDGNIF